LPEFFKTCLVDNGSQDVASEMFGSPLGSIKAIKEGRIGYGHCQVVDRFENVGRGIVRKCPRFAIEDVVGHPTQALKGTENVHLRIAGLSQVDQVTADADLCVGQSMRKL